MIKSDYIRPSPDFIVKQASGVCDACGGFGPYIFSAIIKNSLAKEWRLNKDEQVAYSSRESMFCAFCGSSYRLRALAKALVIAVAPKKNLSLSASIAAGDFENFKIAEINSCGVLHDILEKAPGLEYSEYRPLDDKVPHQDLMSLTYLDDSFDIVLTSDTLEHVPDPSKALKEIYRVLKPSGKHIFTVPIRLNAKTKNRTIINDSGREINKFKPSYHGSGEPDYLVWNEFGVDFIEVIEQIGFLVRLFFLNPINLKDPTVVFVATKGNYNTKKSDYSNIETKFDQVIQINKIADLVKKRSLTAQHLTNIENQNRALIEEAERRGEYASSINFELHKNVEELNKIKQSIPGKIYIIGRSIKRRFKV